MRPARYRLIALTLACGALIGCGVPGIPRPPSLNLPRPVTDLQAIRKGTRVYLSWTKPTETTDDLAIRGATSPSICRSPGTMWPGCAGSVLPGMPRTQVSEKNGRVFFFDVLPPSVLSNDPNSQILYSLEILNHNNRSAGISNVVSVPAVAAAPPPANFRAEVTAGGVVLSWDPNPGLTDTAQLRHTYRVYRRDPKTQQDTIVGELPLDASARRLLDHTFEWEKTYFYRATIVNIVHPAGQSETQFEGSDTTPVFVSAHDVFPPATPAGLQAAFSEVGQQTFIDLIWAPDTEADLAGYNVYRREEGEQPRKINSGPVKAPAFRDMHVASGHTYIYSVSALDVRGNESPRSAEASEPAP